MASTVTVTAMDVSRSSHATGASCVGARVWVSSNDDAAFRVRARRTGCGSCQSRFLNLDLQAKSALVLVIIGAFVWTSCTSGGNGSLDESQRPSPVSNFEVANVSDSAVNLRWTLPDTEIDALVLLRNGQKLATVGDSATRFTDNKVDPGTRYTYEIETASINVLSAPVKVTIKTGVPPVTEARLDGTYPMTFTLLSSNVVDPGRSVTHGRWRLTPLCKHGPCDEKLVSLSGNYASRLAWIPSGQKYRGSVQQKNYYVCGSTGIDAIEAIVVTADSAKVIDGEWTATKLRGQLIYDQNENDSCFPTAHEELALQGKLS
jgi:hypothetical protein